MTTLEQQRAVSRATELAKRARSIKGEPLSQALIDTIAYLTKSKGYELIIGSGHSISRTKHFFREHYSNMDFFDQAGQPMEYDETLPAFRCNQLFMGVLYCSKISEAYVYIYFPKDGIR